MTLYWLQTPGVVVRYKKLDEHTFLCTVCSYQSNTDINARQHIRRVHKANAMRVRHVQAGLL